MLVVARASSMGGMERMALTAMVQAREHGYNVILATAGDSGLANAAYALGFTVAPCELSWLQHTTNPLRLASYAFTLRANGKRLTGICREHNVSMIHAHGPVAALYCVQAARKRRLPFLMHVHDAQTPKRTLAAVTRYVARNGARLVCVSNAVRETMQGIGVPLEQTTVLHNGINAAFLGQPPVPTPLVTGPGPNIGLFANIVHWKGQHVFLASAERLAVTMPNAHFYIVGGLAHPDDQPYLDDIRALAEAPALKGRVTLTGTVTNVREWMAAMDVVAHCSVEREAFGLVIAEAMALGKRVVATDIGAPREIVDDDVTGLLVPPDDPDALAVAIERLIALPPDDPMGRRAVHAIRERFSPERFGNDLAQLYAEMLAR